MSTFYGPRVVPKHCGVWSSANTYEMLNIVLHQESGFSYISRKAVPAGVDISEDEYWALAETSTQEAKDAAAAANTAADAANTATSAANTAADAANTAADAATEAAETALPIAKEAQETADEALTLAQKNEAQIQLNTDSLLNKVDDAYVDDGYLYLLADGEVVVGPLGPFSGTGGGSGSGNGATLTATNLMGYLATTIVYGSSCILGINWSSLEDDMETGNGTLTVTIGGVVKASLNVAQGDVYVDVGDMLAVGTNTVRFKISDVYGNSRTFNFSITTVSMTLTSTFDASTPFTGEITFTYIPTGSVEKTVYFYVDDELIGTETVTVSGRQQSYVIPELSEGTHTLRCYFTAEVNGETVQSNELYYDLMVISADSTDTLISSTFETTIVDQYTTITIPFYVYVPTSLTAATVTLTANGEEVNVLTDVDRSLHTWSYIAREAGTLVLEISCNGTTKSWTITVTESTFTAEAETQSLELYFATAGRSNSESDPSIWKDQVASVAAELSGFNWTSDGWQLDDDGATVLRVAGDARVTIPFKLFENDLRTTGKTIEVEFATSNVRDYDATVFSCWSGDRGIKLTAQEASMASEQASLSMQYKEDEHVRVAFVVEKSVEDRLMCCYINGVLSGVVQYPSTDDFAQITPVTISIGSGYCTTDIYCIRSYSNDLTRFQIVDNWIADTQDGALMRERFDHNNVFDDYGQVVINQLPTDLPYIVLVGDALPEYKGNKLSVDGYFVDPMDASRNFEFTGASIDVQGTSSAGYVRKNYKIKFANAWQMNDDAIATKTFTFKADVASSEGANNVELVRLYNAICPYQTPPQKEDSRVRQGIDGFPMVLFWNNGTETTFMGKYNFNNDKGTEEVYGFTDGDQSWETLNNTSDRVIWKSADYSGTDWENDFEARYPEDNVDASDLAALAEWLVSTDRSAATDKALSSSVTYDGVTYTTDSEDYRLAKFKDEMPDKLCKDSAIFYYLFTEIFLMVDSRAKNSFPTMFKQDGKWCFLPYDMDTAIGINNEGALTFGYGLEDTDTTDTGADVYNGQQSVLWNNIRDAFGDDIQAMYQDLRSTGVLSYDVVETAFEEHQAVWPEAIFNEDAYFKYIQPLQDSGDASYLSMCQGSKAEQRKWWLYNRFKYMDSKYNAGDAASDIITLRGYAKSNITITPYADIYAAVKFGSYMIQTRASRNVACTMECPLDNVNDTEIYIYSCSQLSDVGDLSGLKVGYADFSNAIKLQSIKIGDADSSYSNANLSELYLGNNTLLQTVDARNCQNLVQTVDLSGCSTIEEVYLDGTAVPGVTLPNGGFLTTLHLPKAITNLTIRNQTKLTDLTLEGTDSLTTVWLENIPEAALDTKALLQKLAEGSRIRMLGVSWTFDSMEDAEDFYDLLDTMRGLDENGNNMTAAQVSGTVYIDSVVYSEMQALKARYADLNIVYNHITVTVNYYSWDGSELLHSVTTTDGAETPDYDDGPDRESTAQYDYTFVGWSTSKDASAASSSALSGATTDRNLYAAYSRVTRCYTVWFYNDDGTLLLTVEDVPYGSTATYTGDTPVSSRGDSDSYTFKGWYPSNTNITGDTECTARYYSIYGIEDDWATISAVAAAGTAADFYAIGDHKTVTLNGTVGDLTFDNEKYSCFIIGFDHNAEIEGYNTIHWQFGKNSDLVDVAFIDSQYGSTGTTSGYFRMNNSNSNSGGWASSYMRSTICPAFQECLPEDLKAVLKTVTKYTNNTGRSTAESAVTATEDTIFLLAQLEVQGTTSNANAYEADYQEQYEYYAEGNSKVKYRHSAPSSTCSWWTRSPIASSGYSFYIVSTYGGSSNYNAYYSYGFAPGFVI